MEKRKKSAIPYTFPDPMMMVADDGTEYLPPVMRSQREYLIDMLKKYKSFEALGDPIGYSRTTINHWLICRNYMPTYMAHKIETVLNEKKIQYVNYLKKYW